MVEERAKNVFEDILGIELNEYSGRHISMETVEDWGSLNHLRLMTALEKEFKIKFTMDEINQMTNFEQIVNHIKVHKAA